MREGAVHDPGKEGRARDRPHEPHLRTIVALLVNEEHEPHPLGGREQAPAWQLLFSGVVSFAAVTWISRQSGIDQILNFRFVVQLIHKLTKTKISITTI